MDQQSIEQLILGTHNSMSYLPVKQWYLKPFRFIAKCQELYILDQLKKYRCLDIRVSLDKYKQWQFSHGAINFKYPNNANVGIKNICMVASLKHEVTYIRLILEKITFSRDIDFKCFYELCRSFDNEYKNVIFFGGNYKKDWTQIYNFGTITEFNVEQYISSMAEDAKWYEKICPYLYAKRMNKHNLRKANKNKINLFDFLP